MVPRVAGSSPVCHPNYSKSAECGLFLRQQSAFFCIYNTCKKPFNYLVQVVNSFGMLNVPFFKLTRKYPITTF